LSKERYEEQEPHKVMIRNNKDLIRHRNEKFMKHRKKEVEGYKKMQFGKHLQLLKIQELRLLLG
jgi:hypothetical protein